MAAVVCVLLSVAARPASTQTNWKGRLRTAGGVQVVENPAEPIIGVPMRLVEDLRIAGPGPNDRFGDIWHVAIDDNGNLFAMDAAKCRVDVFSPDGRHLRTVGRRGQGPGELQNPNEIFIVRKPRPLLAFEDFIQALSFFDLEGKFVSSRPLAVVFPVDLRVDPSGRVWAVRNTEENGRPGLAIFPLDDELAPGNPLAFVGRGPEVPNGVRLFDADIRWDVGEDGGAFANGADYEIQVFDASGRVVRKITRPYKAKAITPEYVSKAVRRKDLRVEHPKTFPAVRAILCGDQGRLFVQTWEPGPEPGTAMFDVFDAEGRFTRRMTVPENLQAARGDRVYAIVHDDDDYPIVVRYRISD